MLLLLYVLCYMISAVVKQIVSCSDTEAVWPLVMKGCVSGEKPAGRAFPCSNAPDWCPWLIKHEEEDGHLYLIAMVFFHLPATKSRSILMYIFVRHGNEDISINAQNVFRLTKILSSVVISFSWLRSSAREHSTLMLIYIKIMFHIIKSMLWSIRIKLTHCFALQILCSYLYCNCINLILKNRKNR